MDTNALYEWINELAEKVTSLEDEIESLHYELKNDVFYDPMSGLMWYGDYSNTVQEENEGLKKNSFDLVNVIARQARDNHELVKANRELREKIGTLNDKILSINGNNANHGRR